MLGILVINFHVFLDFLFHLFYLSNFKGPQFFQLALFLVVFGALDVPTKGLSLFFGHHQ
jgi:hypothetical protein